MKMITIMASDDDIAKIKELSLTSQMKIEDILVVKSDEYEEVPKDIKAWLVK